MNQIEQTGYKPMIINNYHQSASGSFERERKHIPLCPVYLTITLTVIAFPLSDK